MGNGNENRDKKMQEKYHLIRERGENINGTWEQRWEKMHAKDTTCQELQSVEIKLMEKGIVATGNAGDLMDKNSHVVIRIHYDHCLCGQNSQCLCYVNSGLSTWKVIKKTTPHAWPFLVSWTTNYCFCICFIR